MFAASIAPLARGEFLHRQEGLASTAESKVVEIWHRGEFDARRSGGAGALHLLFCIRLLSLLRGMFYFLQ
ncbi:MAG: hypothetical protein CMF24_08810 [Ilumatobacter sp.]|nr:hypothetical protein [Ilumatobacter sp.]